MRLFIAQFDNSYARLGEEFFVRQQPAKVANPKLFAFNRDLGCDLGLKFDNVGDNELAALFSGNIIPDGAEPLAMAYAGHQFGHFVPSLGDGRALLLGEVLNSNGERRDLHFKGSGRTAFSRGGDGLAALGPVIRELIVSEAMFRLGIPTTRTLAAVTTGDLVYRESPKPGAILTRVAKSHLRIGTFEFFAPRPELARRLADYAIARHYPQLLLQENSYLGFLEQVMFEQASLVAKWMAIGFIHGVMNTDNMTISGETIDYGPCAFLDRYEPGKVFSSIDRQGRYAYNRQPLAAQWNLARFAECLLSLLHPSETTALELAKSRLAEFPQTFEKLWLNEMRAKFALARNQVDDRELVNEFLKIIEQSGADFTNSFKALDDLIEIGHEAVLPGQQALDPHLLKPWLTRWRERLKLEDATGEELSQRLKKANPLLIPRNHRIAEAIDAAEIENDFAPMNEFIAALRDPYTAPESHRHYALPPLPGEEVKVTFCGT